MINTIFILIFLIPLALHGCATSGSTGVRYDPATGVSTFESDRSVMGYRDMSGGLAREQRVMWQALASCSGQGCIPEEIALAFYNDTSKNLNLDSRRVQLVVDGVTHDWQDLSRLMEAPHHIVPPGEFIRVSLPGSAFVNLAHAQKVEVLFGETGTSSFNVSFARRAKFRDFVEMLGIVAVE